MEKEILKLVESIFTNPPKPKCSFQLELETGDTHQIYNILMFIFINGSKLLFNKTIPKLNEDEFEKINEYMASLEYIINKEMIYDESNKAVSLNIWFDKIKK